MTSGYHQVEVAEEDRDKTAFVDGRGHHLRYVTMPFGLCNAPSTFQRLMERVLEGLVWKSVVVYLDDVVIFSNSVEEHIGHLREVLQRFQQENLKLKPRKCEFFREQVKYLGHTVSPAGVATDPGLIDKVVQWKVPTTVKEVRAFLGLAGYYRQYVPQYSEVAEPMIRLTDAYAPFVWTADCQQAFESLKKSLVSAPILAYPTATDLFVLDTDASNVAIGAVLSQRQEGQDKVIGYGSKALTKEERNYCVTRRELLAVVHFIEHYKYYLYGKRFLLRTDHSSLRWMLGQKEPSDQLARWIQRMACYHFDIEHRPGKKHSNADAMSRIGDKGGKCFRGGVCYHPTDEETQILPGEVVSKEECEGQIVTLEAVHSAVASRTPLGETELDDQGHRDPVPEIASPVRGDPPEDSDDGDRQEGLIIGLTTQELRDQQEADPDLKPLCLRLAAGLPRPSKEEISHCSPGTKYWVARWSQLALRDGVLRYRWEPDAPGTPATWKVVTPHSLRETVMACVHDLKAAGHLGLHKTWAKAKKSPYVWPGMRHDLDRWVRRCQLCQQRKPPASRKRAKMVSHQVGAPWERVAMDIAGPFPTTQQGNKYLLVVQDYFSKWVEVFPMADQTAETVATLLVDQVFSRYGCCRELHSDQGTNFESRLMKEVYRLFGVKKTRTTAYHPRGDGMVERYNRTIEAMLSIWTNQHQTDWDQHIGLLAMAYRSVPHDTTRETPNMLMLGREVTVPVDLVLDAPPEEPEELAWSQYAADLQERLREVHEAARASTAQQMVSQKRHYDANVRLITYAEGDVVWLHNPVRRKGKSPKFMRPWVGPYVIVSQINDVNFRIQSSPRAKYQIVHADRLKPCQGVTLTDLGFRELSTPQAPEPELVTPSGADQDPEPTLSDTGSLHDPSETPGSDEGPEMAPESEPDAPPSPETPKPQRTPRTRRGRVIRRPQRLGDYECDWTDSH